MMVASGKCGFYRLQERLRRDGWYVEWAGASQFSHAWEDMPALCVNLVPYSTLLG